MAKKRTPARRADELTELLQQLYGLTPDDLRAQGITVEQLRNEGLTPEILRAAMCETLNVIGLPNGIAKSPAWTPTPADWCQTLLTLADKARVANKAEPKSETPPAAVSKPGELILAALLKHYPKLQTIEQIYDEVKGNVSERTIGPELTKLIADGLAYRPRGKRKGAMLTSNGKALAEKLSTS
jgi:hypothetical protein